MDILTAVLLFLAIFILTKYFLLSADSKVGDIPCIRSVPLFGSLPFLPSLSKLHVFMTDKSKRLGNVIGFRLPRRYVVVLNGREAIHEALVKQSNDFAGRPSPSPISVTNHHQRGIVDHVFDDHFKKYHSFALNIMKQFGFGKSVMEDRIKVEVKELISTIDKFNGGEISSTETKNLLTERVINVLIGFMFGKRMRLGEDADFSRMIDNINFLTDNAINIIAIRSFPFLKWIPSYNNTMKLYELREKEIHVFLEKQISENLNNDDSFIREFIAQDGPNYDKEQLTFTLRDLFSAGMETTASTLQWVLVLLANHQDVQLRLQTKIDSIVARNEMVSLKDKNTLPNLEAFLLEVMRFKTLVPLALLHQTSRDTVVQGKNIQANTWVMPNLYSAHMDADFWKDPDTFRPSRFLDDEGNVFNRSSVIAFSLGKRSCFGEIMARQELFLFTGNLVQRYSVLPPQGQTKINFDQRNGITVCPINYSLRLVKRSHPDNGL